MNEALETIPGLTAGASGFTRPLVSVIVTFYNQASFVQATLSSVLAQDYSPMEVIVVDDGSTDDTPRACAAFAGRVHYIRQSNGGPCAARNVGMRHARGALLAFLDGDDLWDAGKITTQVGTALRHPEVGMIVVNGEMFSDEQILRPNLYNRWLESRLADAPGDVLVTECHDQFVRGCLVSTPSQVMLRREVFASIGLWDESIPLTGDHELYLRATMRYPVAFIDRRLMRYRYSASSISGPQAFRAFRWGLERVAMLRAHRHATPGHRCAVRQYLRETIDELARDAYHRSPTRGRRWAAAFLARLAWHSRRPDRVLPYLAALAVPARLQRLAGRTVRGRRTAPGAASRPRDPEATRLS